MSNTLGLQFAGNDQEQANSISEHQRNATLVERLEPEEMRRRISGSSSLHSSQKHSPKPPRGRPPRSPYSHGSPRMMEDQRRRLHESTIEPQGAPTVVPPPNPQRSRTLVLLFDGTGDQFDNDNSNLVELMTTLFKDDRTQQMVYYQSGLGTYTAPQTVGPLKSAFIKTIDLMVAWTLDAHVMNGYEFLMQNYTPGDKICLFGFSRGAYTARSLAGMIHKVGLLPPDNWQQVPFAYKMYTRVSRNGWAQSNAFKRAFCRNVEIEFVGVWDTVNSVGLIPRRLPFTVSNTIVHTFRHALSLDERRVRFQANLWKHPDPEDEKMAHIGVPPPSRKGTRPELVPSGDNAKIIVTDTENGTESPKHGVRESLEKVKQRISSSQERSPPKEEINLYEMEQTYSVQRKHDTDVLEVWFAGCHADVGGGSVRNETRHALSRIPLRWMIRECFRTNTGIMFDAEKLQELGLDPVMLHPFVTPPLPRIPAVNADPVPKPPKKGKRRDWKQKFMGWMKSKPIEMTTPEDVLEQVAPIGTEAEEEHKDALSPRYDQLNLAPIWWLLEFTPMEVRTHFAQSWPITRIGFNAGRPRVVPVPEGHGINVHRSVLTRMEAPPRPKSGKKYVPRPDFAVAPNWVD